MAPRWSIILNEHGCQLQVYWRSPNNIEKGYFIYLEVFVMLRHS